MFGSRVMVFIVYKVDHNSYTWKSTLQYFLNSILERPESFVMCHLKTVTQGT